MPNGSPNTAVSTPNPVALQIAGLAAVFTTKATNSLKAICVETIERAGYQDEVAEAVARMIHTREKSTFPQPAEILRVAREVRRDQQVSQGDQRWVRSREELNDLALRRLKSLGFPLDDANVEAELARMRRLGWRAATGS